MGDKNLQILGSADVLPLLENISFHLNQVNADVTLDKNLKSGTHAFVNTHYQGSNVGQSVSVLAGLDIKAPIGTKILIFTGYTNSDIAGYQTKNSLLGTPSGASVGAKYTAPSGFEVGGAARGISGGKPALNGTIKIPLGRKR